MTAARFPGVIGSEAASWLWPDSRLLSGAWTRGVPIDIELADTGLTLSPRTRLLRGERWAPVTLAWDEVGGASAKPRGHTGRTGGLTLREMYEVTVEVVGGRAADFRMPSGVSSLLPDFPADVDVVNRAGYAPLFVTMAHGDDFAEAVSARATGGERS
jgi:hypothetical protein